MDIGIDKIKKLLNKLLNKFWHNLFLILIFLLLLDLILGGIFFQKFYLGAQEKEPQIILPLKINQVLLEKFSFQYSKRESIFKESEEKEYPDPFQGIIAEEID